MPRSLILNAFDMAITECQPRASLMHHSDSGSEYASKGYRKALTDIIPRRHSTSGNFSSADFDSSG